MYALSGQRANLIANLVQVVEKQHNCTFTLMTPASEFPPKLHETLYKKLDFIFFHFHGILK